MASLGYTDIKQGELFMNENFMTALNDALKKNRIVNKENFNFTKVANSTVNVGYLEGNKIERVIIYLRGKGCEWSCQRNGGCLMCGHYYGTSQGADLPKDAYYEQFRGELEKYDFSNIPMLRIYNAGSILNEKEVPTEELLKMLKLVSDNNEIKRIVLESRPEFITDDILNQISEICKNKIVEIGIGLETTNDEIREKCINKGFSFLEYLEAVCRIKKYSNLKVLTYLTVKPLFLTIEESRNDVINSIKDICAYTDIISLEPVSIQKNTVVDYLYELGIYTPPKGWIIKEIIGELEKNNLLADVDLRIGGFEFFPIPDLFVGNCKKCNEILYNAIDCYNASKNTEEIKQLECECYEEYLKEIEKEKLLQQKDIDKRISYVVRKILLQIVA